MYVCMHVWDVCNTWTPSNPLDFILSQDHTFKALYFFFFEDPFNNCLPHKWQVIFQTK